MIQNFDFAKRMLSNIEEMNTYSWKRGELGGLDFGFPQMNDAFEGLTTGLFLVAGPPNAGKSAMMLQLSWQITQANPEKVVCVYFTLDDNTNDILPRIISLDQKIPINSVSRPKRYEHLEEVMARRTLGLNRLKESAGWFNMIDSSSGSSLEFIENTVDYFHSQIQHYGLQLVVFIDNFHDITVENPIYAKDNNMKYDYIADRLSKMCTKYDIPILCTAELRKLNGNRRPVVDDIRETVKIAYEAKAILLCYNEVGIRGENAEVFYNRPGKTDKYPVLEIHVGKNKQSSFKGRIFYEFIPEFSYLQEVPKEEAQLYLSRIS